MPQNELVSQETNQSPSERSEPTAFELRNEWRKTFNTCKRIRTHIAKVQDGRHTLLSDNGIELLMTELQQLTVRMREIETTFRVKRWAL